MNFSRRESIKALTAIGFAAVAKGAAQEGIIHPYGDPSADGPFGNPIPPVPKEWRARWIAAPDAADNPVGIYLYRLAFNLAAVPGALRVRVSADQRFKLYLNDQFVGAGPAQGNSEHWRYEQFDLAPQLRPGRNVLAAVVWFGSGPTGAINQAAFSPGFLLSQEPPAAGSAALVLDTAVAPWRVTRNPGHGFLPIRAEDMMGYFALGPMDRIDANHFLWNWTGAAFDDSGWQAPAIGAPGRPRGFNAPGGDGGHYLEANPMPAQELAPEPLGKIVRVEGLPETAMVEGGLDSAPIRIPAGTKARLLVDHAHMTTAYLTLETGGGAGSTVRLRYAEALVAGALKLQNKGNRNEIAGKELYGYADEFVLDGQTRIFEPLFWRAFRYLQIEVEAGDSPVELRRLTTVFSGAPLSPSAKFSASDPQLATIWQVGVRTLRCNAHEAYSDCPYFEQLQYIGDTRLSALTTFAIVGPRARPIVRNALELFDASRIPEGITQSRYPSREMQLIPPFSLWYVMMVRDFWMHSDDPEDAAFIRGLIPGIRGVLAWFTDRINERGLLGPLPWWNFVDWNFSDGGSPPGAVQADLGGSSILTLQYVLALRAAATLEAALGSTEQSRAYQQAAARALGQVRKLCWNAERGLFADVPLAAGPAVTYSQHPTALFLLAVPYGDDVTVAAGRSLLATLNPGGPKDVSAATIYFRYYIHRALIAAGYGNAYTQWLDVWRDDLALGLTTWPESPEPTRSDCHGWSAHPTRELLTVVLGIESASPGFKSVNITPRLGGLEWAEGVMPHPRGTISVKLRKVAGGVSAQVSLPPGVPGTIFFAKGKVPIRGDFSGVLRL